MAPFGALNSRERAIVAATVEHGGSANKTAALRLFISEHTPCNHLAFVYHNLGVSTETPLYVQAVKYQFADLAAANCARCPPSSVEAAQAELLALGCMIAQSVTG